MSKTIFALLLATFCVSSHVAFGRSVESSLIRRFRRDLIGSDCASDVHRSKRSPCNPLAESSNRFNGKTFEQIREDFRSRNFIEKGETGNSFQCPVTGTQFWLDSAGKSYKSGTEYPHVDVTHPDWPGYKLKFPLGNKLTNELNGIHLFKTNIKKQQVHVTDQIEIINAIADLNMAMIRFYLKTLKVQ